MSSKETAITINNLSKFYHVYDQPKDRLKQAVMARANRMIRKPAKEYFRKFWALRNISFAVEKGETIGIVGRNGSGKSTLLQIICGTLYESEGSVVSIGNIAALLELGSGFNPEFTGMENVFLYGQILGLQKDEVKKRLAAINGFAAIGDFIHQPIKTYSSGMVVRLAFAVSVMREPDILVVDEALAVGDEGFQRKCYAKLAALRENGTTILFVSHAASIIVELCDRAVLLDRGKLLFIGDPKKTVDMYHKLIYAPDRKKEQVRSEIMALKNENPVLQEKAERTAIEMSAPDFQGDDNKDAAKPFFDPDFVSQSRLAYEKKGVTIMDPRIETLFAEQVNNLIHDEAYVYTYRVLFSEAATRIQFGMLIKTLTGLELGGGAHPALFDYIPCIEKGTEMIVRFHFRCMFNPGVYFINAGVLGENNGEAGYLSRLIDAYMFRVQPYKGQNGTGHVNFDISSTVMKRH